MNNHLVKRIERELERVEAFRDVYDISENAFRFNHISNNIVTALSLYTQDPSLSENEKTERVLKDLKDYLNTIVRDSKFREKQLQGQDPFLGELLSKEERDSLGIVNEYDHKAYIDAYCRWN